MQLSLVILAAGAGSRYGGTKQLEAVGPAGHTLMEYSIYDALQAGFERVVVVIHRDMHERFQTAVAEPVSRRVPFALAFQRIDSLPAGYRLPADRRRPWGTGQALLAARDEIDGPFAVVNADDLYGAGAFRRIASFLQSADTNQATYALVAYPLAATLSSSGAVSRAVCHCTDAGRLADIVEIAAISEQAGGGAYVDDGGSPQVLPGDTLVSMNLWGFTPRIFDQLEDAFVAFVDERLGVPDAEFVLPGAVRHVLRQDQARVAVLRSDDAWCGVTHAQDRPRIVRFIRELVDRGTYPRSLWGR